MTKRMLIDAEYLEATRVVVTNDNEIEDFDHETTTKKQNRGNLYLAKIARVEPSLQAAFVDYGNEKHGFLAFSEIHPDYFQIPIADKEEIIKEETSRHDDIDNIDNNEIDTETDNSNGSEKKASSKKLKFYAFSSNSVYIMVAIFSTLIMMTVIKTIPFQGMTFMVKKTFFYTSLIVL